MWFWYKELWKDHPNLSIIFVCMILQLVLECNNKHTKRNNSLLSYLICSQIWLIILVDGHQ